MALLGGIGYGLGLQGKPKDYAGMYQHGLGLYEGRKRAAAKQQAVDAEKYAASIKPADNMLPAFGNANVEDMSNTLAAVQEDLASNPNIPVKRQRIINDYKGRTKLLQDANYATQGFINAGEALTEPQMAVRSMAMTATKPEDIYHGITGRQDYQLRDETGKPFLGVTVGPDGSIAQGERNPKLNLQKEFQNMFQKWQLETVQELQQKNIGSTVITQITARMPETRAEADQIQKKYGLSYVPSFEEKVSELYKNQRFYTQNKLDSYGDIVDVESGNLKVAPEQVEKKLYEDFKTRGKLGLGVGTVYKVSTQPGAGQKAAQQGIGEITKDPITGGVYYGLTYLSSDTKQHTLPPTKKGKVFLQTATGEKAADNVPTTAHIKGAAVGPDGQAYVELVQEVPSANELQSMNPEKARQYLPPVEAQKVLQLQSELYGINDKIAKGFATDKEKASAQNLSGQLEKELKAYSDKYAYTDGTIRYRVKVDEIDDNKLKDAWEGVFNSVAGKGKFDELRKEATAKGFKKSATPKVSKNNTVGFKPEL